MLKNKGAHILHYKTLTLKFVRTVQTLFLLYDRYLNFCFHFSIAHYKNKKNENYFCTIQHMK